LIQQGAA